MAFRRKAEIFFYILHHNHNKWQLGNSGRCIKRCGCTSLHKLQKMTDEIKRAKREIKGYGKKKEIQNPTKVKRMNMHRHKKKAQRAKRKGLHAFFSVLFYPSHTVCLKKRNRWRSGSNCLICPLAVAALITQGLIQKMQAWMSEGLLWWSSSVSPELPGPVAL